MTLSEYLAADEEVEARIPCRPDDALAKSHSLLSWDHLQVISGTNVNSEAAPKI